MLVMGITVGVKDKNNSIIEAIFPRGSIVRRPDNTPGVLAVLDETGLVIAEFNKDFWMYWEITGASVDED